MAHTGEPVARSALLFFTVADKYSGAQDEEEGDEQSENKNSY